MTSASVTLPGGRLWLLSDDHLTWPVSFLGADVKPAKVRKGLVEFLAIAHHWGGAMGVTGAMRHVGVRAVSLGLARILAGEALDGKKTVHYALTGGELVADLAERCFHAARLKGTVTILPDGDRARVPSLKAAVAWADVPTTLPDVPWLPGAKPCPACRCTPDDPCPFRREDGEVEGYCVAAGVHELAVCSACEAA